jgi:hypothetical protein
MVFPPLGSADVQRRHDSIQGKAAGSGVPLQQCPDSAIIGYSLVN